MSGYSEFSRGLHARRSPDQNPRRSAEHAPKRPGQVRRIREAGDMCGLCDRAPRYELAGGALQPQPAHIGPQRSTHRLCEHMDESRRRFSHVVLAGAPIGGSTESAAR